MPNAARTAARNAGVSRARGGRCGGQDHDRGVHVGPRIERAALHREEARRTKRCLREDGERTVRFTRGRGDQALGDLGLHHEDRDVDEVGEVRRLLEQRAGDEVRQVARERARRGQPFENDTPVDLERVGVLDRERARRDRFGEAVGEDRNQLAIALDRDHPRGAFEERTGEGAEAGTDLEHAASGRRRRSRGDRARRVDVLEEVLPELLLWPEPARAQALRRRHDQALFAGAGVGSGASSVSCAERTWRRRTTRIPSLRSAASRRTRAA